MSRGICAQPAGAAAPPKKKGRGRRPSPGSQLSRSSRKVKRQLPDCSSSIR